MVHLRTPAIETSQFTVILRRGLAFVLAIASLNSPKALAQTNGLEQDTGQVAANGSSASDNANAEILQELERMRARIQELEARLKQQPARATAAGAQSDQPLPFESQQPLR